jgi:hypothetical protein
MKAGVGVVFENLNRKVSKILCGEGDACYLCTPQMKKTREVL